VITAKQGLQTINILLQIHLLDISTLAGSYHHFDSYFETPLTKTKANKYTPVLEMVRLSPSASNKQRWRLVLEGNCIHFFLQRTRGYGKPMFGDPAENRHGTYHVSF